ncbi:hypothetical protein [Moorena producens]|uniref:hypothetical protein n=1 Tax=Moorena producens TaxID=1155739 RepID=UPI00131433D2|nr:hypothetical protein [Moorena producens]
MQSASGGNPRQTTASLVNFYQAIRERENPASNDRVRSYRLNKAAFMVGRLWVKG